MVRLLRPMVIVLALALLPPAAAGSQELPPPRLDLESVLSLAVGNDSSLVLLERRLASQLDALGWGAYRDALSFRLSGSLSGPSAVRPETGPDLTGSSLAQLNASVQLLPQVSLTGSLAARVSLPPGFQNPTYPVSGSLGLSFQPLADTQGRARQELALDSTRISIDSAVARTSNSAIGLLFSAMEAAERIAITEEQFSIAQANYDSLLALAARERATDHQVRSAADSLRSAGQSRERALLSRERTAEELARTVGTPVSPSMVPSFADLDLKALVEAVVETRASVSATDLAEQRIKVRESLVKVQEAELALASARRFTPRLTIGSELRGTAEFGMEDGPKTSYGYSASAEFSVSPADWDGSARAQAEQDLRFAQADLEAARGDALFSARSALLDLDFALENLAASERDYAAAGRELAEAKFRYNRGDITALALRRAELAVDEAALSLELARATVIRRWYTIQLVQF